MPSFGFLLFPHEAHTSSLSPPVLLQVQLQLLTAIVKLFLKKPTETQELVQQVLSLATQVGGPASPLCPTQLLLHKGHFGPDPGGPAPKTPHCEFGPRVIQNTSSRSSETNQDGMGSGGEVETD